MAHVCVGKAPTSQKSLSGPSGVSDRVSPKMGVSEGVSHGVSKRCPDSVPGVSGHLFDTVGTPFWHSGARGPKGPGDTPWDTPLDTPSFGDTLSDSPGHFGPEGPERLFWLVGAFPMFVVKFTHRRTHGFSEAFLTIVQKLRTHASSLCGQLPASHRASSTRRSSAGSLVFPSALATVRQPQNDPKTASALSKNQTESFFNLFWNPEDPYLWNLKGKLHPPFQIWGVNPQKSLVVQCF